MSGFKLDLCALDAAICDAYEAHGASEGAVSAAVLSELAAQLRPHVPGAQEGEGLEVLLGRLIEGAQDAAEQAGYWP